MARHSGRTARSAGAVSASAVRERIVAGAARLGLELEEEAATGLATYLVLLHTWNARLNLVGEHDVEALAERHVVDSLAAVPLLRDLPPGARLADLGSGAGLPGVPLALVLRPAEMALVEPRRKRASFLRAVQRALPSAPLRILQQRAEEVAQEENDRFAAVVTRAALPDAKLLPVAARLLKNGGLLISYRGADAAVEHDAQREWSAPESHAYRLENHHRAFHLHVRRRRCST